MLLSLIVTEVLFEWLALLIAKLLLLEVSSFSLTELASLVHLTTPVSKPMFLVSHRAD
jgi:hypothetical protein